MTSPTPPTELTDIDSQLKAAMTHGCRLAWARRLVRARWEAGLYPMVAALDDGIVEYMARALVKEYWPE